VAATRSWRFALPAITWPSGCRRARLRRRPRRPAEPPLPALGLLGVVCIAAEPGNDPTLSRTDAKVARTDRWLGRPLPDKTLHPRVS
jgi:hypothetical protein